MKVDYDSNESIFQLIIEYVRVNVGRVTKLGRIILN